MAKKFYACVYGGASDRIDENHKNEVERLGKILVENGYSLVYGAGATGCMGAVANGVRKAGGYVMGVSPHFIKEFEDIFDCDNTIMVETMSERKTLMESHADVFIIAPGGIGTLDEFFQVLTLRYLERIKTPIVVLNLDGFYNSLIALLDDLAASKAATQDIHALYDVVDKVDDEKLIAILQKVKKG